MKQNVNREKRKRETYNNQWTQKWDQSKNKGIQERSSPWLQNSSVFFPPICNIWFVGLRLCGGRWCDHLRVTLNREKFERKQFSSVCLSSPHGGNTLNKKILEIARSENRIFKQKSIHNLSKNCIRKIPSFWQNTVVVKFSS